MKTLILIISVIYWYYTFFFISVDTGQVLYYAVCTKDHYDTVIYRLGLRQDYQGSRAASLDHPLLT